MMQLSQKCQYALRAMYELAIRFGRGPASVSEVAAAQAIPPKFLELILGQLRRCGLVISRRGSQGGYELACHPREATVGQVIRLIEGPLAPVSCVAGEAEPDCPLHGRCAFMGLWQRASEAISGVYDNTSFEDLLAEQQAGAETPNYCI